MKCNYRAKIKVLSLCSTNALNEIKGRCNSKFQPRTVYEVPEGDLMYNSTFSLTSALVVSGRSASRPCCFTALPPGKPGTHCIEGWVGYTFGLAGSENLAPPGFDSRTVQPVASRYSD